MKKINTCEGSDWTGSVSDYDVMFKKTWCAKCNTLVAIKTSKNSNIVKILRHSLHVTAVK